MAKLPDKWGLWKVLAITEKKPGLHPDTPRPKWVYASVIPGGNMQVIPTDGFGVQMLEWGMNPLEGDYQFWRGNPPSDKPVTIPDPPPNAGDIQPMHVHAYGWFVNEWVQGWWSLPPQGERWIGTSGSAQGVELTSAEMILIPDAGNHKNAKIMIGDKLGRG